MGESDGVHRCFGDGWEAVVGDCRLTIAGEGGGVQQQVPKCGSGVLCLVMGLLISAAGCARKQAVVALGHRWVERRRGRGRVRSMQR